jgi:two-component system chemotaxis response regulator CheY
MAAGRCDVLLVDDQATIRQLVSAVLHQLGIAATETAKDGVEAIEMLEKTTPGALLLDVNMPRMNGLELLQRVRAGDTAAPRDLPVLMLTGHGEGAVVGTALALDANGFVLKPVSPASLKQRLARVQAAKRTIKDAAAYRAVPIPDVTIEGATMPAPPPLPELPQTRKIAINRDAIGKTLAAPIYSPRGQILMLGEAVLTPELVACLEDLAEIEVLPPEILVKV